MRTKDEYLLHVIGQQAAQAAAEKVNLLTEIDKRTDEIVALRGELETVKKALAEKA